MNRLLVASFLLFLSGCATTGGQQIRGMWIPSADALAVAGNTGLNLRAPDGTVRYVPAARLATLLAVKPRIEAAAGVRADLGLADVELPNAFAFVQQGRPVVAFSLSWLEQLGTDPDALAVTLGHELAHLKLGHSGDAQQQREAAAAGAGQFVGTILNTFIPFSGMAASLAITGAVRSFTRDEERAADDQGMLWAVQAGYNPCGKARVVAMYQRLYGGFEVPFLATHPGYTERTDLANQHALRISGRVCG